MPLFHERYPDLNVVEQIFVMDRNRITCAGGAAATDMMLHLIALDHGHHAGADRRQRHGA